MVNKLLINYLKKKNSEQQLFFLKNIYYQCFDMMNGDSQKTNEVLDRIVNQACVRADVNPIQSLEKNTNQINYGEECPIIKDIEKKLENMFGSINESNNINRNNFSSNENHEPLQQENESIPGLIEPTTQQISYSTDNYVNDEQSNIIGFVKTIKKRAELVLNKQSSMSPIQLTKYSKSSDTVNHKNIAPFSFHLSNSIHPNHEENVTSIINSSFANNDYIDLTNSSDDDLHVGEDSLPNEHASSKSKTSSKMIDQNLMNNLAQLRKSRIDSVKNVKNTAPFHSQLSNSGAANHKKIVTSNIISSFPNTYHIDLTNSSDDGYVGEDSLLNQLQTSIKSKTNSKMVDRNATNNPTQLIKSSSIDTVNVKNTTPFSFQVSNSSGGNIEGKDKSTRILSLPITDHIDLTNSSDNDSVGEDSLSNQHATIKSKTSSKIIDQNLINKLAQHRKSRTDSVKKVKNTAPFHSQLSNSDAGNHEEIVTSNMISSFPNINHIDLTNSSDDDYLGEDSLPNQHTSSKSKTSSKMIDQNLMNNLAQLRKSRINSVKNVKNTATFHSQLSNSGAANHEKIVTSNIISSFPNTNCIDLTNSSDDDCSSNNISMNQLHISTKEKTLIEHNEIKTINKKNNSIYQGSIADTNDLSSDTRNLSLNNNDVSMYGITESKNSNRTLNIINKSVSGKKSIDVHSFDKRPNTVIEPDSHSSTIIDNTLGCALLYKYNRKCDEIYCFFKYTSIDLFSRVTYRNVIIYKSIIMKKLIHHLKKVKVDLKNWKIHYEKLKIKLILDLLMMLDTIEYKNIVFMGCLNVLFREVIDTRNLSDFKLYDSFIEFTNEIKECMESRDKYFWNKWLPNGWNKCFYYGCFIVEEIIYGDSHNTMRHVIKWTEIPEIETFIIESVYNRNHLISLNDLRVNNQLQQSSASLRIPRTNNNKLAKRKRSNTLFQGYSDEEPVRKRVTTLQ